VLFERRLVQLVHEELLACLEHVLIQSFVVFSIVIPQDLFEDARGTLWVVHSQLDRDRISEQMSEPLSRMFPAFFLAA